MTLLQYLTSSLSQYWFQWAFALAPLPAYLPQYWALCKISQDPILQMKVPKALRRCASDDWRSQGTLHQTGSFGENGDTNPYHSINQPLKSNFSMPASGEGGFSPIAILLLLLSHILRLLYCCGSALVTVLKHGDKRTIDKVRLDLMVQSAVMIGMQVFLLSIVTRMRRNFSKKTISPVNRNYSKGSGDQVSPSSGYFFFDDSLQQVQHDSSMKSLSHISPKPFRWIGFPSQYWTWHTLHQHIEFLFLLILTSILCICYLYPNDAIGFLAAIRNISVLLESCLAIPQLLLNYRRKNTTGLSLLMVINWFIGDMLKTIYFLLGESAGAVFVLGTLFAMVIDLIVVIQILFWFPSPETTMRVREIRRQFAKCSWNMERRGFQTITGEISSVLT